MPKSRPHFPLAAFLALYLPAGALALGLGHLTSAQSPGFAVVVQLALGTAAYALAVDGAAEWGLRHPCATPLIDRILHLRRNRLRYALGFGVIGAVLAVVADAAARRFGFDTAYSVGPLPVALVATGLFALAWFIIGMVGDRPALMHRALDEALTRRKG